MVCLYNLARTFFKDNPPIQVTDDGFLNEFIDEGYECFIESENGFRPKTWELSFALREACLHPHNPLPAGSLRLLKHPKTLAADDGKEPSRELPQHTFQIP